ncbi:MAG: S53 family peptidase [Candidatus Binatus sp.]
MSEHPLKGSERQPMPGAKSVGKSHSAERLEVTVLVRRQAAADLQDKVKKLVGGGRSHISRHEFAKTYGAAPADFAAVKKFAEKHGLAVVQEDAARRSVVLSGTVAHFNDAFGVDLQQLEYDGGSYRGRTGAVRLPPELKGIVEGVFGLDNRPQAKPHFRARSAHGNVHWKAQSSSFDPNQVASLYDYPGGNGKGECIVLIELGGGYRPADLSAYFSQLKIPLPKVSAVSVDHGKNHPTGDANGPDGEVMLDIEVAGAIAPAAHIVAYFTPNTDAGFLDAITTAIHDSTNKPSVISISWGGPESGWTQQAMTAFDEAFQAAAALGITVCVAAGDNGSSDGVSDGANHVDFPASSPFALACGGTNLQASGGSIVKEVVWNDGANGGATGGGVSSFFPVPPWQEGLKTNLGTLKNRGVPDVSGDADPDSGYDIRVDGSTGVFGGTSAVAPLWAALIALINSAKGTSAGYLNPTLYKNPGVLHDITQGNNGAFTASPGWDACTGLGSPDGKKVAGVVA